MKIGVFGTGMVGQTIGAKLIDLGHDVKLGSRTASNEQGSRLGWQVRLTRFSRDVCR